MRKIWKPRSSRKPCRVVIAGARVRQRSRAHPSRTQLSHSRSARQQAEQGRRRTSSVLLVRTRPPTSSAASSSTNDTPACIHRPAWQSLGAGWYRPFAYTQGSGVRRFDDAHDDDLSSGFRTWCRRLAQHSPATPPPTITTSVASVLACARTLMRPVRIDVRAGRDRAPRSVTPRLGASVAIPSSADFGFGAESPQPQVGNPRSQ